MPQPGHEKASNSKSPSAAAALRPFRGFAAPTSNTTYTPNQFFDVCIPHSSRGVVRLVAYMIRKTLGWCDSQGNPQEARILVTYQHLVSQAGISREMIRKALDEAVAGHFIRCVRDGRAKRTADGGQTALYELCWDDSHEYVKDPKRFRGFFEGEGNRTDIPNEFFDRLVPRESLAVIKAVASVIRFSIGFQARRGVRRQHVQLSYSHIQRYGRIASRATLSEALATAISRNYISRLEEGVFDPDAGRLSRAAVYADKWADGFRKTNDQRTEPPEIANLLDHQSETRTGDQSENRTGNGRKDEPEKQSEIRTGIEMKQRNETFKQQAGPVAVEMRECWERLKAQGFDAKTALTLATRYPECGIARQISWLALRAPVRNPLGMLRRSIEENWPDPTANALPLEVPGAVFASHFYAALAGNEGNPVAEATVADAAAGERYLRRLAVVEGEIDPARCGSNFGRMIVDESPSLAGGGIQLAVALRLRGDSFYLRHKAAVKARKVRVEMAAREAHEAAHRADWMEYLKAEERRVKDQAPEVYAHFEARRADELRRMIESRWVRFTHERLTRFDGEERRVLDFQTFLAGEVLDFWTWDAQLNPHSFTATLIQARVKP